MAKEPNFNPDLGSSEAYLELMQSRVNNAQEKLDDAVARQLGPEAETTAQLYLQEQQGNLQKFMEDHPELKSLVTVATEAQEV